MTNPEAERPSLDAALTDLTSARVPWLALARDPRTMSGATVIGTASEGTFDFVRELGAQPVARLPSSRSQRSTAVTDAAVGPKRART